MYHVTFRGTHREAGLRRGRFLASHGNFILQNAPFPVTLLLRTKNEKKSQKE